MALIKCENLELAYDGRTAVRELSFEVNPGDYLCIVGENGSGKSTLIKALLSLKSVSGGSITFGDGLKHSQIGYMPQQNAVQRDFPASVWEVVLSGRQNHRGWRPFYTSKDKADAEEKMELLGITSLRNRCYRELSGGQQQRVLLARALCATEKLILLDEPSSGLDPVVTAELYGLIKRINQSGTTVIMVTHDPAALEYASHVLHLNHKMVFFGGAEEYKANEAGKLFLKGGRGE